MANILFKKGSYSNFKANVLDKTNAVTPGALYLTEDERIGAVLFLTALVK